MVVQPHLLVLLLVAIAAVAQVQAVVAVVQVRLDVQRRLLLDVVDMLLVAVAKKRSEEAFESVCTDTREPQEIGGKL